MICTTVNRETTADKLWSDLRLGTKVAGSRVAIAWIGASFLVSVSLAGAAVFGALVMMVYGTLARRGKGRKNADEITDVLEAES